MIQPTGETILVEPEIDHAEETEMGLVIPETAYKNPCRGTVVGVGSRVRRVSEGDRIVFAAGNSTEIDEDGIRYFMREREVILVMKESE